MNTNILNKCVEELKKENPKLDYVLGMLETIIEMSQVVTVNNPTNQTQTYPSTNATFAISNNTTTGTVTLSDEEITQAETARNYAIGPIAELG